MAYLGLRANIGHGPFRGSCEFESLANSFHWDVIPYQFDSICSILTSRLVEYMSFKKNQVECSDCSWIAPPWRIWIAPKHEIHDLQHNTLSGSAVYQIWTWYKNGNQNEMIQRNRDNTKREKWLGNLVPVNFGSENIAETLCVCLCTLPALFISCYYRRTCHRCYWCNQPNIARFMGSTWGPPGFCRPQMVPMLAPWNLLSGKSMKSCTGCPAMSKVAVIRVVAVCGS